MSNTSRAISMDWLDTDRVAGSFQNLRNRFANCSNICDGLILQYKYMQKQTSMFSVLWNLMSTHDMVIAKAARSPSFSSTSARVMASGICLSCAIDDPCFKSIRDAYILTQGSSAF